MAAFLVLLFPVLLMVFALAMSRVEDRLKTSAVSEVVVEEFLEQAQPDEMNALILQGWGGALDRFRRRRRAGRRSRRRASRPVQPTGPAGESGSPADH